MIKMQILIKTKWEFTKSFGSTIKTLELRKIYC